MTRVLVGCVGNVLRGDDGFGPAVAERLSLPAGARLVETGIGGIALLQELMTGCDALVLVDAMELGSEPGTVASVIPEIGDARHVPDVHLANPQRVLETAKGLGVLPDRVVIVGCQPTELDELGEGLSPPVALAVEVAAREVERIVRGWIGHAAA